MEGCHCHQIKFIKYLQLWLSVTHDDLWKELKDLFKTSTIRHVTIWVLGYFWDPFSISIWMLQNIASYISFHNQYIANSVTEHYGSLESYFQVMSLDIMEGFWRFSMSLGESWWVLVGFKESKGVSRSL